MGNSAIKKKKKIDPVAVESALSTKYKELSHHSTATSSVH